jgi:hypothetical protein
MANVHTTPFQPFNMAVGTVDLPVSRSSIIRPTHIETYMTSKRIYNAIAVAGIAVFYFPESYLRSHGKSTRSILANIDFVGAAFSITGLTLLLVSLFCSNVGTY